MANIAGQVISGSFDRVVIRQKSKANLEIGQLLTAVTSQGKILMQVFDLVYGSQLSQQNLEMISGMKLENDSNLTLMDKELRNYTLAFIKPLLLIQDNETSICKRLPEFFSNVLEFDAKDALFLDKPKKPVLLGNLRSGSKILQTQIFLNSDDMFSHHVLITAQTGRGKSNLMSCLVLSGLDHVGFLILDPHDEYYGKNKHGLKDAGVLYYTPKNPPAGTRTLTINLRLIRPWHFNGVVFWSDPQKEALYAFYRKYNKKWIQSVLLDEDPKIKESFHDSTLAVVKRRLLQLLSLDVSNNEIFSKGIFDVNSGISTVSDIIDALEKPASVIIDTSSLSSPVEILIGSIVASELLSRYQGYKSDGSLKEKPVVSCVLEEAPRVLGNDVLEQGPNIFSKISREGRKFKVGLTAITQLPSLIPRHILANIGTKITLGIETAPERKAIIESAAQDLSQDDRAIASLDIGEAIVTSTFSKFAIPIKAPLFDHLIKKNAKQTYTANFEGLH